MKPTVFVKKVPGFLPLETTQITCDDCGAQAILSPLTPEEEAERGKRGRAFECTVCDLRWLGTAVA